MAVGNTPKGRVIVGCEYVEAIAEKFEKFNKYVRHMDKTFCYGLVHFQCKDTEVMVLR